MRDVIGRFIHTGVIVGMMICQLGDVIGRFGGMFSGHRR